MAEVFADTSGWGEYYIRSQSFNALAGKLVRQWQAKRTRVITTNYVLAELVSLLTSPLRVPRSHRARITDAIRSAPWVDIVHIDPALDAEAWTLLKRRPDKDWSLVDCVSFTVMTRRGITDALTTDHHFEQAGFARLLK
jgi:predicted nucleic acid-binding protein